MVVDGRHLTPQPPPPLMLVTQDSLVGAHFYEGTSFSLVESTLFEGAHIRNQYLIPK